MTNVTEIKNEINLKGIKNLYQTGVDYIMEMIFQYEDNNISHSYLKLTSSYKV